MTRVGTVKMEIADFGGYVVPTLVMTQIWPHLTDMPWPGDNLTFEKHIKSRMSNLQQFDLAAVKNINRSQDTWDLLDKLGKGKIFNLWGFSI